MTSTTETTSTSQPAAAAAPGAPIAPKESTSTKAASRKKNAATGQRRATPKAAAPAMAPKTPKGAPAKAKATKTTTSTKKKTAAAVPRELSKKQIVLDLLRRKGGATMAEIQKATGWLPHSVRGFISGALGKKMGLTVESTRSEAGERTYRIAK